MSTSPSVRTALTAASASSAFDEYEHHRTSFKNLVGVVDEDKDEVNTVVDRERAEARVSLEMNEEGMIMNDQRHINSDNLDKPISELDVSLKKLEVSPAYQGVLPSPDDVISARDDVADEMMRFMTTVPGLREEMARRLNIPPPPTVIVEEYTWNEIQSNLMSMDSAVSGAYRPDLSAAKARFDALQNAQFSRDGGKEWFELRMFAEDEMGLPGYGPVRLAVAIYCQCDLGIPVSYSQLTAFAFNMKFAMASTCLLALCVLEKGLAVYAGVVGDTDEGCLVILRGLELLMHVLPGASFAASQDILNILRMRQLVAMSGGRLLLRSLERWLDLTLASAPSSLAECVRSCVLNAPLEVLDTGNGRELVGADGDVIVLPGASERAKVVFLRESVLKLGQSKDLKTWFLFAQKRASSPIFELRFPATDGTAWLERNLMPVAKKYMADLDAELDEFMKTLD